VDIHQYQKLLNELITSLLAVVLSGDSMSEKIASATDVDAKPPSDDSALEDGPTVGQTTVLSADEFHLATLGYRQEFRRTLGFFESWAATLTTMN
jgi:hypothetical protein